MFVIQHHKFFFILTALLFLVSLGGIIGVGVPVGIDFKGGALLEISYPGERPEVSLLEERIRSLPIGGFSIRETGDTGYIIRTRALNEAEHQAILALLSQDEGLNPTEERFTTIGPVIGQELRNKALVAIVLVLLAIILFIAYAFRGVSEIVSSWKYGIVAVITLVHDIVIPSGAFVAYSMLTGAELDILFVMALLAILGYSVNDTIVIFDRVRENLKINQEQNVVSTFRETVGQSLSQTYVRSINTSLTTAFVLLMLFLLGGSAIEAFAFVLLVGVIAGTYSSLFFAAPLLVWIQGRKQ